MKLKSVHHIAVICSDYEKSKKKVDGLSLDVKNSGTLFIL